MTGLNYFRVCASSPLVKPADVEYNVEQITYSVKEALIQGAGLIAFPELSLTGYTCADLFQQNLLLSKAEAGLFEIADNFKDSPIAIVVGAPLKKENNLYNCAVIIYHGDILGVVPKSHIPNYGEFYEKRWFASGMGIKNSSIFLSNESKNIRNEYAFGTDLIFDINNVKIGLEICEDLWVPIPPSSSLSMAGAEIIVNLSASNELIGKHRYLMHLISNQSARCRCGYIYSSAGTGESSTDLAFSGNAIIAENGSILAESPRFRIEKKVVFADIDIDILRHDRMHYSSFTEGLDTSKYRYITVKSMELNNIGNNDMKFRSIKKHPFLDENKEMLLQRCEEISSIQAWGLAMRLRSIGASKCVIGISGGLDSTLALLVTVKAFDMLHLDRNGIYAITMPGFGTTGRTKSNADKLMEILGVTRMEIPIAKAVKQHFADIGQNESKLDVTYENSQARERTQILMDIANKENALVVGTGDLSELALGWCTYNGDHMSMYGVNVSIPKTLVKYLVEGYATESEDENLKKVLWDIIDTPISPELLPADSNDQIKQKTEDLVGPYELHDFFLYYVMRYGMHPHKIYELCKKAFEGEYSAEIIKHWLKTFYRRFFNQQFKRSCMPDGIKAGSVCLSPRGDWRMPSDVSAAMWLREIEKL